MFRASPCIAAAPVVFGFAGSGAAYACLPPPVVDLPETVETALGPLSGTELSGYCRSANVVVARVESLLPIRHGTVVRGRLQLRVLTVIREGHEPLEDAVLEPSTALTQLRERVAPGDSTHIQPVLDSVWVLGFSRATSTHGTVRKGDPAVWSFRPLGTAEEIDTWSQTLQRVLETTCEAVTPPPSSATGF